MSNAFSTIQPLNSMIMICSLSRIETLKALETNMRTVKIKQATPAVVNKLICKVYSIGLRIYRVYRFYQKRSFSMPTLKSWPAQIPAAATA
jgi:hypothetical protein